MYLYCYEVLISLPSIAVPVVWHAASCAGFLFICYNYLVYWLVLVVGDVMMFMNCEVARHDIRVHLQR